MRHRTVSSLLAFVLALALSTPSSAQEVTPDAPPEPNASGLACEIQDGIPYHAGSFVYFDHVVTCNRPVKSITVRGWITKNESRISPTVSVTCGSTNYCDITSQYYHGGARSGSWHGWTNATITDMDGTILQLPTTRSRCLITP